MATCAACGASSRSDVTFAVTQELDPAPLTRHSLAGVQLKISTRVIYRLAHGACGWSVVGYVDGDSFVAVDAAAT